MKHSLYFRRRKRRRTLGAVLSVAACCALVALGWLAAGPFYNYIGSILSGTGVDVSQTNSAPNGETDSSASNGTGNSQDTGETGEDQTLPSGENGHEGSQEDSAQVAQNGHKALWFTASALADSGTLEESIRFAAQNGVDTFVIQIKDRIGKIAYKTDAPLAVQLGTVSDSPADIDSIISRLHESGIRAVALMACFRDDTASRKMVSEAVVCEP